MKSSVVQEWYKVYFETIVGFKCVGELGYKMKVLFLCFEFCGNRDPVSQCVQNLRCALYAQGVGSDVLTYAWAGEKEKECTDKYGTIFLADTWYRYARMKRNAEGTISMSPAQWMRAAAARGYSILREGRFYAQRGVPLCAAECMGKRLRVLCETGGYDWVISTAYPFSNHRIAVRWCPPNMKLALYNFDPYWNNGTYPSRLAENRAKEEKAVYRRANCVFCTPEQMPDYQVPAFQDVISKIHPLPYPKLVEPKIQKTCPIQFDPVYINLLYLGTVYGDIRKPQALFRLFERASEIEPRLRLYIIGKKFGVDADRYLTEYSAKLGDKLRCYAPVPSEQTADLLLRADILVNLGNTVHNQMPSKLVEYIATGKPILNISVDETCNTLPLLEKYPLGFQWFYEKILETNAADAFVVFCKTQKDNRFNWNRIKELYADMSLAEVAKGFLHILQTDACNICK